VRQASPRLGDKGLSEDLLTERSTLGIPRSCHNAYADLLRKQQVLGSNPSVGSTHRRFSDLGIYLLAGRHLIHGEPVYAGQALTVLPRDATTLPFLYPPPTLLLNSSSSVQIRVSAPSNHAGKQASRPAFVVLAGWEDLTSG
jgi:hypothetical protein